MRIKTAVIIIMVVSFGIIVAAYYCRGYWATGAEWFLPAVMAMVIPLKEKE